MISSSHIFLALVCLYIHATCITCQMSRVTHLPGLSDAGYQPKMYSGYLKTKTHPCDVFSVLVLADESPDTKPFIVFQNGGPGASSLQGFIVETGPALLESDGKTLLPNPERWNKFANVLFMELPGDVGFSHSKVQNWNDEMFAVTFFEALQDLQNQLPQFLKPGTPIWLTGESYFGAYGVVTMAHILKNTNRLGLDFRGLFIGNGVSNRYFDDKTPPLFMREHAIISEHAYLEAFQTCGGDFSQQTEDCQQAVHGLWLSVFFAGMNPYNIYDTCIPVQTVQNATIQHLSSGKPLSLALLENARHFPSASSRISAQPDPLPCVSIKQMEHYFNQESVQKALNVRDVPHKWTIVDQDLSLLYNQTANPTAYILPILQSNVPIRYFSGDIDLIVNVKGTLTSIETFARQHHLDSFTEWGAWKDRNGRLGGFNIGWSVNGSRSGEVRVVTVRGGSHMAASNRARQVVDLLQRFMGTD